MLAHLTLLSEFTSLKTHAELVTSYLHFILCLSLFILTELVTSYIDCTDFISFLT